MTVSRGPIGARVRYRGTLYRALLRPNDTLAIEVLDPPGVWTTLCQGRWDAGLIVTEPGGAAIPIPAVLDRLEIALAARGAPVPA